MPLVGARKFLGLSFISVKGTENSKPFQWYQLTPCGKGCQGRGVKTVPC